MFLTQKNNDTKVFSKVKLIDKKNHLILFLVYVILVHQCISLESMTRHNFTQRSRSLTLFHEYFLSGT